MSTFDALHPRASSGQFADKQNSAPNALLSAPPEDAPAVDGYLRLQQWGPRDELLELSTERIDVRAVLDTYPLSQVRTFGDLGATERVVDRMREQGIISHDGPADLDIYGVELDEYIAAREAAGKLDPVTGQIVRPIADVEKQLHEMDAELTALRARRELSERQYLVSLLAPMAPSVLDITVVGDGLVMFDAAHTRVELPRDEATAILHACDRVGIRGTYRLGR